MKLDLTSRRRRRIVRRVSEASSAAGMRALGAPTGHADQVTSPLLANRSMILDFKTEADMEKFPCRARTGGRRRTPAGQAAR